MQTAGPSTSSSISAARALNHLPAIEASYCSARANVASSRSSSYCYTCYVWQIVAEGVSSFASFCQRSH